MEGHKGKEVRIKGEAGGGEQVIAVIQESHGALEFHRGNGGNYWKYLSSR